MLSLSEPLHTEDIKLICSEHFMEIVHGSRLICPDLVIRYVDDEGKFGYAHFGQYFFMDDCMYILRRMRNPDVYSNPDIFGEYFGEHLDDPELAWNDCRRVIFAGVRTVNKDSKGEWIYTGDIVECVDKDFRWGGVAAFPGTLPRREGPQYAILGDNHSLLLRDAGPVRRIGTIFYQIEPGTTEVEIESRCIGLHTQGSLAKEEVLNMCVYTPSFEMEYWKYIALAELGVEYDWRGI